MSSKTSKTVLRELEKASYLVTSIRGTQPLVNARLAELPPLGPSDDGGEVAVAIQPPDWDHLQNWAIGTLEASGDEIRRTDHAMRQLRVRIEQLRSDRRDEAQAMSSDYRALRRTFSGLYGSGSLALIGLDAEPAPGMLALREQSQELIQRMRAPQLVAVLPPPRAGQPALDLEALTQAWQARLQRFDELTESIDRLSKEAQEQRVKLDEIRQQSRRVYANVGRLQEGLYRLAGLDDLADRMRAVERARRKQDDSETEETSSPDSPESTGASDGEALEGEASEGEASEGEVRESTRSLAAPEETVAPSTLPAGLAEPADSPVR